MTQIEQIKAEIKRQMNNLAHIHNLAAIEGRKTEKEDEVYTYLYRLYSFIELQEKEQEVDLEKEIDKWYNMMGIPASIEAHKETAKHFYKLGLTAKEQSPKIKGWVARDLHGDLFLYSKKPFRSTTQWQGGNYIYLNKEAFPESTWEDEPIEVELLINRV